MLTQTYFGNTILQYIYFFGIIGGSIVLGKIVAWIVSNVAKKATSKTKNEADDLLIDLLQKPFVFLIFIVGLKLAKLYLAMPENFSQTYNNVVSILLTIDIAWFLINFADTVLVHYISPLTAKTKSDLDDHIIPLLRKLVKFIIISITIITIIDNFGYDVTSLVAGLGIGGLAFALAAKDILGNFFGGIAIVTDRPFKIGDRIRLDEKTDGFVTDIGLRTTRIKTLDGTMLTIPNSKLIDSILENVSAENARKVKLYVGVEYGTSVAKMKKAKELVEKIIKKNKGTKDESIVSFIEFGDSSLKFLIIYWIKDLDKILDTRHEINMAIKEEFEKAKIEMAFPTRTVYMKKG